VEVAADEAAEALPCPDCVDVAASSLAVAAGASTMTVLVLVEVRPDWSPACAGRVAT